MPGRTAITLARRTYTGVIALLVPVAFAVAVGSRIHAQPQAQPRPAVPVDPIQGIIDAFQSHAVVALGEGAHGNEQGHAFRLSVIRDPRFAATVNDIVVESGNGRYQDVVDRFVRGEDVPNGALRQAQETTQAQVLQTPLTEELFSTVRDVNVKLPRDRQLRVLLGDSPIDWDMVHSAGDYSRWMDMRETFPASLVLRECIVKRRRALIIYGDMHLQRKQLLANYESEGLAETLVSRLESVAATKVFTIKTELTVDLTTIQADVANWPRPSLALLRGTTLGAADFARYYPYNVPRMTVRNGNMAPVPREQWRTLPMEDQFDALLYLGPPSATTFARPSAALCGDSAYLAKRAARLATLELPSVVVDQLTRACDATTP
jgi:erythromycin esterase-like protein